MLFLEASLGAFSLSRFLSALTGAEQGCFNRGHGLFWGFLSSQLGAGSLRSCNANTQPWGCPVLQGVMVGCSHTPRGLCELDVPTPLGPGLSCYHLSPLPPGRAGEPSPLTHGQL